MKIRNLLIGLSLVLSILVDAQKLTLGELFNEGAVLQQHSKVSVWGAAVANENITVSIQGKKYNSESDTNGNWTVELKNLNAGGPFTMTVISANDTIKLNEIYVGEVWIAGGQSNMAFMLEKADNGKVEIVNSKNKNIRFVMVPYKAYEGDKNRGDMNWRTATAENVANISAVAYYFAKYLQAKLNVPIGIICCYKGGSGAETWMSREALLKNPLHSPIVEKYESYISKLQKEKYQQLLKDYQIALKQYQDSVKAGTKNLKSRKEPMGEQNYNRPFGLYNTMLKRVIPYSIKGAIWYQGEHNSSRAVQYQTLFPAMIEQWRTDFKNSKMPFLFVQLPGYANADAKNRPIWPELREAQLLTWQNDKNAGMAVTIELGQKDNIHPTHKEPVGNRLAIIAFKKAYGMNVPYSGPVYKKVHFKGNEAVLSFGFIYGGLKSEGDLKGFSICGADQKFVPAKAIIKNKTIIVTADSVEAPVAVRYGWENWTEANLKNSADLMASPFRTDDFPLISSGNLTDKY